MYFIVERIKRILEELQGYIYSEVHSIKDYKLREVEYNAQKEILTDVSDWEDFREFQRWGGRDKHYWFRTEFAVPEELLGKTLVFQVMTGKEGQWDALNPQFLAYLNGKTVQGLDVNHREILLTNRAEEGQIFNIALYAYAGMQEGLVELNSSVAILNRDIEKLYYDIKVPIDAAVLLDKEDIRRIDILKYMTEAVNMIDLRKPYLESFHTTIAAADEYLQKEFYEKYCGKENITALCVGHTHIDVAWLWTLAQTREKTARSFATVINLMKQYPEYIFMSSQPQLYKFIKEDQPEIYEDIKNLVKEGRWEPEGAMWLEADCNLISGESLVRQIMFGTRFFKEEFGIENKVLWLPDVFGYSAALPQILKKSGIDYFMTTKISWNEYNKMPYDTFKWKGIDGSEVLTHFITTKDYERNPNNEVAWTTYTGVINPSQIAGAWQRYQQKHLNNEIMVCFGYGDGGGGPTKEMLETARRLEKGIPGSPKVKLGKARDFFERLDHKVSNNSKLPKWVGELYLEYHRGTYTSMARNKRFNRKSEFLFEDIELWSSVNGLINKTATYPRQELKEGWETILLNQFHDIIPGSSIKEVYEDSKKQYLKLAEKGKTLLYTAIEGISSSIALEHSSVVVFNQLGFVRSDIAEFTLPDGFENIKIETTDGRSIETQLMGRKVIFFAEDVPAKGYKAFRLIGAEKASSESFHEEVVLEEINTIHASNDLHEKEGIRQLENDFFKISLDSSFAITSIYDKRSKREVLKENEKGNVLQVFEDKPHNFDAWDINIYYQEKMWEIDGIISAELIEKGPIRFGIKIKRKFLDSVIEQIMYIYKHMPRIDFVNFVDWKEKQLLLKVSFPVDVHSNKATYEIQYGNVERPTHWNTSWDYARFEVCGHKWADLSEGGYGVSLLNDCKYGHDIKEGRIRLTLLKSAVNPNPEADKEQHVFTYSLYPHEGDFRSANTVQMAYKLNCPMYVQFEKPHEGILPKEFSFASMNKNNVVLEVVKKAEESEEYILRLYEGHNCRTKVNLTLCRPVESAYECDLLERNTMKLQAEGNKLELEFMPFEIKTIKVKFV